MQQLTLREKPHRNHYLFSDYYLDNRVSDRREWSETNIQAGFETLVELWQERGPALEHANESQTEADWIRPVLRALGHHFAVQVSIQAQGGNKTPDYVFCPDEVVRARLLAHHAPAGEAELAGALAVGDAKAWDRPLDRTLKEGGIKTLHEHPGLQIDFYIRHSGLNWGVLTNGRLWRLYHKDSSKKLDVFYEVDLPALLEAGDDDPDRDERFKYFWLFFRRDAFVAGSFAPGHPAWLDLVLSESQSYEQGVSDSLKAQVYEALQALAQGFLDYPANNLPSDVTVHPPPTSPRNQGEALAMKSIANFPPPAGGLRGVGGEKLPSDPATLKDIYDNSLIVLYRLLFILYAEDRDLLPLRTNEMYRETYSLQALKQRVARELDARRPVSPTMSSLWQRLLELWGAIDRGDATLGIPAYNGGLFKPERHPFLETNRVGDSHLRQAIDLLARIRDAKTGKAEWVDYRDLEIRHLGSIYEGLLEYHIQADKGEVSLLNDKGERKATGSYYTPDYIVQYIVEHTVGPVLAETAAPFLDAEGGVSDPAGLEKAILTINVLDPAMGSGHFLVAAADFIARFMVERGVGAGLAPAHVGDRGGEGEGDREGRPYGDDEGELAYWRRRVAQACIYGVDLNPLAVELAKLSLWLATVSKDKPLSFLDHHLRCGNSLIGAHVADLPLQGPPPKKQTAHQKRKMRQAAEAGQISMLDDSAFAGSMRTATGMMDMIEGLGSETLADVRQAETVYRDSVRAVTAKARLVADLWTARHFGLDIGDDVWQPLVKHLLHGGFAMPGWDEMIARGQGIAGDRRFFHWELEFPEVFFDEHGRLQGESAGFEAVVGNPPYVRQEQMAEIKHYLAEAYREVYSGTADLYVYFYRRGLELLKAGAPMSYIVNNKWLRAGYGKQLRNYFATNADIESILDFGHAPIFQDADTFPCIVIVRRKFADGETDDDRQTQICHFPREQLGQVELDRFVQTFGYAVPANRFGSDTWSLERQEVDDLMAKIRRNGIPLTDYLDSKSFRGVVTGFNKAFLIDTKTKLALERSHQSSSTIIHPYLRGQDIGRWRSEWNGLWMIFTRRGIDIDQFPAVRDYLSQYRERLEPKPRDWSGGRWPGRKPGFYKWYEIQDSVDYWELFAHPKILYQEIQFHPRYSLDTEGLFFNNKVFMIPSDDRYLLGILNSPLMWWHNWRYLPHMKDEALSPKGDLMVSLPIAPPTAELRSEIEPRVERVIELTMRQREIVNTLLDWLNFEFGVTKPGQRLASPTSLSSNEFVAEVKKRQPRSSGKLTPAALKALRSGYDEQIPHLRTLEAEALNVEYELSDLVNQAYGLTPEEVALLWETAPPRMPIFPTHLRRVNNAKAMDT